MNIYKELHKIMQLNQDAVLLSIIEAKGSVPRGAGAKMIVKQDGTLLGTIGGGAVEHIYATEASKLFTDKQSYIKNMGLENNGNAGMVCGGAVKVLMEYIPSSDKNKSLFKDICDAIDNKSQCWLVTKLLDDFKKVIFNDENIRENITLNDKPCVVDIDGESYYSEMVSSSEKVYIFGGGHVAQEVVPVLSHLGFYCVLVENREFFANKEHFPNAAEIHCINYDEFESYMSIGTRDYVILMTNTHKNDLDVLSRVVKLKPFYLGVMGSRNKINFVTEKLLECGYTLEEINKTHMPIGLPILAETPSEIAISVAAEIIKIKAEKA